MAGIRRGREDRARDSSGAGLCHHLELRKQCAGPGARLRVLRFLWPRPQAAQE